MIADVTTKTNEIRDEEGAVIKKLYYLKIKVGENEMTVNVGERTVLKLRELNPKTEKGGSIKVS